MRAALRSEGWKTARVFVFAGLIPLGGLLACAIVALLGLLVFSILAGEPTPDRPFTALDFFPAEDAIPADYRIAQAPQPAGPEPRWALVTTTMPMRCTHLGTVPMGRSI